MTFIVVVDDDADSLRNVSAIRRNQGGGWLCAMVSGKGNPIGSSKFSLSLYDWPAAELGLESHLNQIMICLKNELIVSLFILGICSVGLIPHQSADLFRLLVPKGYDTDVWGKPKTSFQSFLNFLNLFLQKWHARLSR